MIGMGTCGTISGIGKYLKEKKPEIKIVGIDPKGSILKELFEKGTHGKSESYKVEGIGEDMKPGNCDFSVVDEIMQVQDKDSLLMTRALLNKEGIFCGTSSGAAVVGALAWMAKQSTPKKVIVILPDSGNRYLSKVFNDAWMIENSFLEKKSENSVGDMIKVLHNVQQDFNRPPAADGGRDRYHDERGRRIAASGIRRRKNRGGDCRDLTFTSAVFKNGQPQRSDPKYGG